jgi:hypothetical protein
MKRNLLATALAAGLLALSAATVAQNKTDAEKAKPPDPKVLQTVFDAFAGGLPEKWESAWVVVREVRTEGAARDYRVDCMYQAPDGDAAGKPIASCDRKTIFENVYSLNRNLPEKDQRRWTRATLRYQPDGKFELKYGYEKIVQEPKSTETKETKQKN